MRVRTAELYRRVEPACQCKAALNQAVADKPMSRITSLSKHSLRTLQLPLVIPKRVSYAKSQFFNDGNKAKNLKCGERWNATVCHKQGCITCPSHDKLAKKKSHCFTFPITHFLSHSCALKLMSHNACRCRKMSWPQEQFICINR